MYETVGIAQFILKVLRSKADCKDFVLDLFNTQNIQITCQKWCSNTAFCYIPC